MKVFRLLVIATAMAIAAAGCELSSARISNKLVKVGDSDRRVFEVREPDRRVQLQTREGGAAGYRFDYYLPRTTVQVYVRGGRVTTICRIRD